MSYQTDTEDNPMDNYMIHTIYQNCPEMTYYWIIIYDIKCILCFEKQIQARYAYIIFMIIPNITFFFVCLCFQCSSVAVLLCFCVGDFLTCVCSAIICSSSLLHFGTSGRLCFVIVTFLDICTYVLFCLWMIMIDDGAGDRIFNGRR